MFVQRAGGSIVFYEFNATTGTLTQTNGLYNGDGSHLVLEQGVRVVGMGTGFAAAGGIDVFIQHASGQIAFYETNPASGKIWAAAALTNADGSAFTLPIGSTIISTGSNVLGDGGNDIFVRSVDGQLTVEEFNASGVKISDPALNYVGSDQNLLRLGGADEVYQVGSNNNVVALEFSSMGAVIGEAIVGHSNGALTGVAELGSNSTLSASSEFVNLAAGVTNATLSGNDNGVAAAGGDHFTVTGTGNVLSINGGGNVVQAASGDQVTVNGNGPNHLDNYITLSSGTVAVGVNTNADIYGSGNTVNDAQGSWFGIAGSNNIVDLVAGTALWVNSGTGNVINASNASITIAANLTNTSVIGAGNAINAGSGDTLTATGTGNTVSVSSATVNFGTGSTGDTVNGNSDAIGAAGGDSFTVTGTSDVVTATSATVNYGAGSTGASLIGNSDTVSLGANGGLTVTGDSNSVTAAAGATVSVNGGNNTITANSGDSVTVLGNGAGNGDDSIVISNGTVTIDTGAHADVYGSGNTITGQNNSWFGVTGDNETINAGSGDSVWLNNNGNNTVHAADGDHVTVTGNGSQHLDDSIVMSNGTVSIGASTNVDVYGSGDTITGQTGAFYGITGSFDIVDAGASNSVWVNSGSGNIVNASSDHVTIAANLVNESVIGNNNAITANSGDKFDVKGTGDTINGSGATIYLDAGTTAVTINGSNDTVHIRGGDTYTLNGTNDTVVTDTVISPSNGGTVNNFNGNSNLIDLASLAYDSSITAATSLNAGHTAGTLTVTDHGVTVDTINLTNITSIGSFYVRSDGAGGTLLVDPPSTGDEQTSEASVASAPVHPGSDGFSFDWERAASHVAAKAPPVMVDHAADQFVFGEALPVGHEMVLAGNEVTNEMGHHHLFHAPIDLSGGLAHEAGRGLTHEQNLLAAPHVPEVDPVNHHLIAAGDFHLVI